MNANTTEDFNFSVEPVSFGPFAIGSKQYVLKEATEDAYTAYRNVSMRAMRLVDGNTTVSEGGSEADTLLVQRCLFEIMGEGKEVPVKLDFVRGLSRKTTSKLYAKVRAISGMDEDEETKEFLEKRVKRDTEKLAKLAKDETPVKND